MASNKVTIKDVAREAGVSISTVSNALNGVQIISAETRNHVKEVAARLNYIPNINGRNLKVQKTNVIGLFISSIRGPYYGVLTDCIYEECIKNGYELNIFLSSNAENVMTNILGKRVDGVVILNEYIKKNHLKMLVENEIPTVFIDREQQDKHISSVVFDSFHEGEQAGRYLLELGHKTFMFIRGIENNYDSSERERGFRKVLKQAGYELQDDYVLKGEFERICSYNSIKEFLETGKPLPDAIFAANDESAIGTIQALTEEGIAVPEQVNVIGCDDIEIAQLVNPTITTIRTSFQRQGALAIQQLVRLLKEGEEGEIETLRGRIIPRGSTCPKE